MPIESVSAPLLATLVQQPSAVCCRRLRDGGGGRWLAEVKDHEGGQRGPAFHAPATLASDTVTAPSFSASLVFSLPSRQNQVAMMRFRAPAGTCVWIERGGVWSVRMLLGPGRGPLALCTVTMQSVIFAVEANREQPSRGIPGRARNMHGGEVASMGVTHHHALTTFPKLPAQPPRGPNTLSSSYPPSPLPGPRNWTMKS